MTPLSPNPVKVIINHAPKFGLDPVAVLAFALEEGGLSWGAVGDQGTSFGPFQAHIGGANPHRDPVRAASWANSPQGLVQMMGMMSRTSAKGKRGRDAVKAIELEFGRGADPAETVRRAYTYMDDAQRVYSQAGVAQPQPGAPVATGGEYTAPGGFRAVVAEPPPAPVRLKPITPTPVEGIRGPGNPVVPETPKIQVRMVRGGGLPPLKIATDTGDAKQVVASKQARTVIDLARHYLGTPYKFGGADPKTGFDCSGFVQWLYKQRGVNLPRTTFEQVKVGVAVSRDELKPGDLVFFNTEDDPRGPSHEGLYIGGGRFLHAPHTGDVVKISNLGDDYYSSRLVAARRVA